MWRVSKSVLSGLSLGLLMSTGVQAQGAEQDTGVSSHAPEAAPSSDSQGSTVPSSSEAAATARPASAAPPAGSESPKREVVADEEDPPTYGTKRALEIEPAEVPENPKRFTGTISGGSFWFSDPTMADQFVPYSPTLRLQFGRQWINQFQLQLDLQRVTDTGYNEAVEEDTTTEKRQSLPSKLQLNEDDTTTSGDETSISLYNLELGLAYRLDYFYEQPIVPYLAAGIQGSLVTLTSEDAATSGLVTETGHRVGAYVGGGLEWLLDTFEPARAADLELSSGINDTYLLLDFRYNWLNKYVSDRSLVDATGVLLDGWQVTAGLKFDF